MKRLVLLVVLSLVMVCNTSYAKRDVDASEAGWSNQSGRSERAGYELQSGSASRVETEENTWDTRHRFDTIESGKVQADQENRYGGYGSDRASGDQAKDDRGW